MVENSKVGLQYLHVNSIIETEQFEWNLGRVSTEAECVRWQHIFYFKSDSSHILHELQAFVLRTGECAAHMCVAYTTVMG